MRLRSIKFLLYFSYLIYGFAIPIVLFSQTFIKPLTVYQIAQVAGIISLTLFSLQTLLTSRIKLLSNIFGYDNLVRLHQFNAKLALFIILSHPLLINTFYIKSGTAITKLPSLYTPFHYLGYFSLVLILITIFFAIYHSRLNIKYQLWRSFHRLNWIIFVFLYIHIYKLGSNFIEGDPLYYWGIFLAMLVILAFIYKYFYVPIFGMSVYKVKGIQKETTDITTIYLYHQKGPKIINSPGQFAFIKFKSDALSREEHHFTISSIPQEDYLTFTIKNSGDFTQNVKNIQKGDIAYIEGPFGSFTNKGLKGNFLFIAGGIGITPIISMLKYNETKPQKSYLLYSCKDKGDIAFMKEIENLSKNDWFDAEIYLTQEDLVNGYKMGRIDEYAIKNALRFVKNPYVFLVGPEPMMNDLKSKLISEGVPKNRIFTEKFSLK